MQLKKFVGESFRKQGYDVVVEPGFYNPSRPRNKDYSGWPDIIASNDCGKIRVECEVSASYTLSSWKERIPELLTGFDKVVFVVCKNYPNLVAVKKEIHAHENADILVVDVEYPVYNTQKKEGLKRPCFIEMGGGDNDLALFLPREIVKQKGWTRETKVSLIEGVEGSLVIRD